MWLGGCPPLLEEQPPGELKPHRFMSEMELYTRWLLACGSKELERVWQLRLLPQTWGGERCGRRQHARRGDKDGSCTRRAAAAKQSCTRRAATAKPGRGRRGRRTAGELAHRRGAQGHRRQWSRPQWGVRVWTLASLGEGEGGVKAIGRPGSQVGSSVGRSVDQDLPIVRGFHLENRNTDSSRLCGE